jgi:hypothetical protein
MMSTCSNSDRVLSKVLAGLAITVTFVFAAVVHAVFIAQPFA